MATLDASKWGIDVVKRMFPRASYSNIGKYFSIIDRAIDDQLAKFKVSDTGDVIRLKLYAYATIRVENSAFCPKDERPSRYNTLRRSPRPEGASANVLDILDVTQKLIDNYHLDAPFALYDDDLRSKRNALGNSDPGTGAKYKGRGFIQLTGRTNYVNYAARASAPEIVEKPERAGTPEIAARILAA
jgi:hypothetical protein